MNYGMEISAEKTKIMKNEMASNKEVNITISGQKLETNLSTLGRLYQTKVPNQKYSHE